MINILLVIATIILSVQIVSSFGTHHAIPFQQHQQQRRFVNSYQLHVATISQENEIKTSNDNNERQQQDQQQHQELGVVLESSAAIGTADVAVTESSSTITKSWTDDGFVFGLKGSGLQRPKGRTAVIAVEGDSLETKPYQQAIVSITFIAHTFFFINSFIQMLSINNNNILITCIQSIIMIISSWIIADFGSGVLHWSVDNYGNGKTPIMGSIIAAFQGHHTAPWTITQRGFCNNVYKLCIPFGILPMIIINYIFNSSPYITFFMTFFCIFEILSQEFHKWSHQLPSESPKFVNTLQKYGITISRKPHAQHHLEPFDGNYSIISGITNKVLDYTGFFRRLEHYIYNINGIEANSWKLDPLLRTKTLSGDYTIMSK